MNQSNLQVMINRYDSDCDQIELRIEALERELSQTRNEERKSDIASVISDLESLKNLLERLIGYLEDSKIQIKEYEESLKVTNEYMSSMRL